jgi:hypothetical protein
VTERDGPAAERGGPGAATGLCAQLRARRLRRACQRLRELSARASRVGCFCTGGSLVAENERGGPAPGRRWSEAARREGVAHRAPRHGVARDALARDALARDV